MIWISLIIALIVLLIGSITDLKKREVPDFLSYGLIFAAFGVSIIYSIINWDYTYFMHALMGYIIGFGIAHAMFYLGQWGGGDSKLLMGLGATLGFNAFAIFGENNFWLLGFLVFMVFVGAIYGLGWSIYLAIKNRKEFLESAKKWSEKKGLMTIRRIMSGLVVVCIFLILFAIKDPSQKAIFMTFLAALYIIFYIWMFVKIIEESCMIKRIPISKLTEGDWIYKNVYVGKKLIAGPKDLGISKEQISVLKKLSKKGKIKDIIVKEGIPFIPAFFLAFILVLLVYHAQTDILRNIFSNNSALSLLFN